MSKTRLRGAFLLMLAFMAYSYLIVAGGDLSDFGPPFVTLGTAVFLLAVGYYLWPKVTFHIDRYRDRGYTIRPSWVRVLQTIAVAVIVGLISLLFDLRGRGAVDWAEAARFALFFGAICYFLYLPPRADDAPGRGSGAPNGTLPTAQ